MSYDKKQKWAFHCGILPQSDEEIEADKLFTMEEKRLLNLMINLEPIIADLIRIDDEQFSDVDESDLSITRKKFKELIEESIFNLNKINYAISEKIGENRLWAIHRNKGYD